MRGAGAFSLDLREVKDRQAPDATLDGCFFHLTLLESVHAD
jgi:hypothetical protein